MGLEGIMVINKDAIEEFYLISLIFIPKNKNKLQNIS